jgi:hypothetical protein
MRRGSDPIRLGRRVCGCRLAVNITHQRQGRRPTPSVSPHPGAHAPLSYRSPPAGSKTRARPTDFPSSPLKP